MKRSNFKKIIELRSTWEIDKKRGDYKLPNGDKLSDYIGQLVDSQLELDHLMIRENGDLCFGTGGQWNVDTKSFDDCELIPDFEDSERCSYDEQQRRIRFLVKDIVLN